DGALTRKVRKGPHWILMEKEYGHSKPVGTIAPSENITQARKELGGEEGAKRREKAKKRGAEKKGEENHKKAEKENPAGVPKHPGKGA
ncbi:hypothetical protein AKJ41_06260, partial [candidate division MSBL1 archaeon SCGC-AAA259O05]